MESVQRPRGARVASGLAMAVMALAPMTMAHDGRQDNDEQGTPKTLYVWAGDQARTAPDFLAVVDFDEDSPRYGRVIRTVPVPAPGSSGNEPHHCHLSADKNTLACGGLLALLRGQNSIFLFDVSQPRPPSFRVWTSGTLSIITDDFLPLKEGGFLVAQMGSHSGGTPGRVAEFNADLQLVGEWPPNPPEHDFNPHGISARPELNLMVTSDFMMPASSLNVVPGDPLLRGIIRVWNFHSRSIVRTIVIPSALGTMDVKLIPKDPLGRAFTAGMFDGLVYLVDTTNGTWIEVFDCETIVP